MSEENTTLPIGDVSEILAVNDTKNKVVEVPEWGCSVKIKALTKADQIRVRKQAVQGNRIDEEKMEGLMFVYGVVEPQFKPEHIGRLFEKSSGPVDRVLAEILALSGMTDADVADAKAAFQD